MGNAQREVAKGVLRGKELANIQIFDEFLILRESESRQWIIDRGGSISRHD